MLISDEVAGIIEMMLKKSGGTLELRRNELALRVGCAPSQINYVITSRFTPERGYVIESRRGGGGYVRIIKKPMDGDAYLAQAACTIKDTLDCESAKACIFGLAERGIIDEKTKKLMCAATSQTALSKAPCELRNSLRADIMRQFILSLIG